MSFNPNPIKLVEFKGQFVTKQSSTLSIEKEINTVNLNLHTGTWQLCVKNFSYICTGNLNESPIFMDVISNLLYQENPSEPHSKIEVVLSRILCRQNKAESINGDTWFNVIKGSLSPSIVIRCHDLSQEKIPVATINVSVLMAFRRVY